MKVRVVGAHNLLCAACLPTCHAHVPISRGVREGDGGSSSGTEEVSYKEQQEPRIEPSEP